MSIARALEIYGREHAPHVASPATIGYRIDALLPFWGERAISTVKGETCRAYVKHRSSVKSATAKLELQTLGAAMNYCEREGYLTHAPKITVPKTGKGRTRWLTRQEVSKLLQAGRRSSHLATFILIGVYTGSRSAAILGLQWAPNTTSGWVDLERGTLHRKSESGLETNKRQPPCPIPAKLTAHLRRVRARTVRYVIEYDGKPVGKLRNSWARARARAGLGTDVTPHILRHTCVTWLLQARVPIWEVAGYVGMSEKMVSERYGHHHPDFLKTPRDAL